MLCQVLIRAPASTVCTCKSTPKLPCQPALFEQDRASLGPVHCCTVKRSSNKAVFERKTGVSCPPQTCRPATPTACWWWFSPALQLQCLRQNPVNCCQPTRVWRECGLCCHPHVHACACMCCRTALGTWGKSGGPKPHTCQDARHRRPAPLLLPHERAATAAFLHLDKRPASKHAMARSHTGTQTHRHTHRPHPPCEAKTSKIAQLSVPAGSFRCCS